LYGLGRNATGPIKAAAARFGILEALDQQVGGYSTGMKTRLALARSVMHEPELLLFDEPTSGLDPESSHAVLNLIREMTSEGCTVVMCTHLLVEAEGLADQIVVLESVPICSRARRKVDSPVLAREHSVARRGGCGPTRSHPRLARGVVVRTARCSPEGPSRAAAGRPGPVPDLVDRLAGEGYV
jgi:ABC-type Mn2+/Zn2+ transport system ATPase subunit